MDLGFSALFFLKHWDKISTFQNQNGKYVRYYGLSRTFRKNIQFHIICPNTTSDSNTISHQILDQMIEKTCFD